MSTAVLDRPDADTDVDWQELFDNDAPCMYTRGNKKTGEITFRCDQSAAWAGICRKCGTVSLLCEDHYIYLNGPSVQFFCSICLAEATRFPDLYMCVHKI